MHVFHGFIVLLAIVIILLGGESCETFVVYVNSEWVNAGYTDIDTHVKLVAI